jgi:hypothetical protein
MQRSYAPSAAPAPSIDCARAVEHAGHERSSAIFSIRGAARCARRDALGSVAAMMNARRPLMAVLVIVIALVSSVAASAQQLGPDDAG